MHFSATFYVHLYSIVFSINHYQRRTANLEKYRFHNDSPAEHFVGVAIERDTHAYVHTPVDHAGTSKIPFTHGHKPPREIIETQDRRRPWYHASSRQLASLNGTETLEHGALSFICTVPLYPTISASERPLRVNVVPLIPEQKVKSSFTFGNRDDPTIHIRIYSAAVF